jgi:hypothetical protein
MYLKRLYILSFLKPRNYVWRYGSICTVIFSECPSRMKPFPFFVHKGIDVANVAMIPQRYVDNLHVKLLS